MPRRSHACQLYACLLLVPLAATPALGSDPAAPSSPDAPAADPAAAHLAFAAALEACVPAEHRSPHPFVRDFVIEHRIGGMEDGHCAYRQSMPGNMHMECKLGEASRAGLATEFRELAEGRMSGGTGEQPAWTGDCEVVTADGKRMPIGKQ